MEAEISLNRIGVRVRIGITEDERAEAQELEVDAVLRTDIRDAVIYDDLEEAVDYVEAVALIEAAAGAREYRLVETFSYELCRELLGIPKVISVRVRVTKRPGVLEDRAESVSLSLELAGSADL